MSARSLLAGFASISRRTALFAVLVTRLGCRSGNQASPTGTSNAAGHPSSPAPSGLEVALVTHLGADEQGGIVLVLLHGYGAQGDDLVPLARSLVRPHVRVVVPAAPLSLPGGGRAWWHIDAPDRPRYVTDEATLPPAPNAELEVARGAVQEVLRRAVQLYAPEHVFIAGFSQGAMLSLDVAAAGVPAVERVAVLSGALLVDAVARLSVPGAARPAVFISHGQEDARLPFSGAERMRFELEERGFAVVWQPFRGGHEIPDSVQAALQRFLFG